MINNKKFLLVFIDGLKPESVECMPFVNSLSKSKRVKTELGYSVTCHASMYSGVYPKKHLRWFIWRRALDTSPFNWISKLKFNSLPDNFYIKYLCWSATKYIYRNNTSIYKLPFIWRMPLSNWQFFEVSENKFWTDRGFLNTYPSLFDILSDNNILYKALGLIRNGSEQSSQFINKEKIFCSDERLIYLFFGDLDPISHIYGQDSKEAKQKLRMIDTIIERAYRFIEKKHGELDFILFSDHGHTNTEYSLNLNSLFRAHKDNLKNYIYILDDNYARFWFRNEREFIDTKKILSNAFDKGFILSESDYTKYHVNMPDNRYGDLIFYLDRPFVFDHTMTLLGSRKFGRDKSIHGYLPDYRDSDGVLVSNRSLVSNEYANLVDILPTILSSLELEIPKYMDGVSLWR